MVWLAFALKSVSVHNNEFSFYNLLDLSTNDEASHTFIDPLHYPFPFINLSSSIIHCLLSVIVATPFGITQFHLIQLQVYALVLPAPNKNIISFLAFFLTVQELIKKR
jgi:hypothetical protein